MIEFQLQGSTCTGFTYDVSSSGIFVRSVRLPSLGTLVVANLHLAAGKRIAIRGRVVRAHRVPAELARVVPSGFSMRLSETPEDYSQLVASL